MEIQKATQFIDDISSDDYFAVKSEDWYKNDVVLILTQEVLAFNEGYKWEPVRTGFAYANKLPLIRG